MAERRMFAKTIIDSDAFLDMPQSAQLLYFHLSMRADDDGFINNPNKIIRIIGSGTDDMKILTAKKFIIPFESGIVVIKHWNIHNYIAKDRYSETKYHAEKSLLDIDENKAYTKRIQPVDTLETQVRLGKVRIGKDSIGEEVPAKAVTPCFSKPSLQEIIEYCQERKNAVSPERFLDYYESNGWMVGRNKMKDWHAAVRTWEKSRFPLAATPTLDLSRYDGWEKRRENN